LSQPRYLPTDLWRLIAWVVIDHVNRQVMWTAKSCKPPSHVNRQVM
jgi:hypothetical protein